MLEHQQVQQSKKTNTIFQKQATSIIQTPASNPYSIIQRAKINPKSLNHADVMQLQRTIGNRAVAQLLSGIVNSSIVHEAPIQRSEIPEEEEKPMQGKFETVQRSETPEEEEPLQGKMVGTVQRQEIPEEEPPMQGKFESIQRQKIPEDEEPLQGKFEDKPEIACTSCFAAPIVQRQELEDEEKTLQGKMIETIQRQEIPEEEPLQGKMAETVQRQEIPEEEPLQTKRENNTGMPDNLKAGVENLSGIDMSDVRVNYNSDKPAEVGALAYAQGADIHVAPGQEKNLPHETWHVVQQAQGRVKPTMQLKDGVPVNDDKGLEHEADVIGAKAFTKGQELTSHGLTHVVQPNERTIIRSHQAADFTSISENGTPSTIQLYSAEEAFELIERKYKKWRNWYYEVCMPSMQTIAAKSGQDFNQYWSTKSENDFEQAMQALHTEATDESSFFDRFTKDPLVDSKDYPGMKRVPKTNILVDSHINGDDVKLQNFITLYNSGGMVWYRGMSISHFSYNQLKEAGVLGSEGTADIPMFTMGNASPTRWLPGLYNAELADAVAHSVDGGDAGIRDIATRKDIPIGVTVQYAITPPMHVAYLNDGEQVIRGPVTGATVYRVILMGPGGYSYRLANGNTTDLPPGAPYHAGIGSQAITAWEALIDTWLLNHH